MSQINIVPIHNLCLIMYSINKIHPYSLIIFYSLIYTKKAQPEFNSVGLFCVYLNLKFIEC